MDNSNALVDLRCPQMTCRRPMERQTPGTPEQAFVGAIYHCPRCRSSVLFPSAALEAQLAEMREKAAKAAAKASPELKAAFQAWLSNDAYLSNGGHYRLKSNKGRIAPWNKAVRKAYPETADFHEAAHDFAKPATKKAAA